jgi:uncharacterized protein (TIGR00661 family)
MRILYGIQGTGNGHITRSTKVISRLKSGGHDVDILISGKFHQLNIPFDVKYQMQGFNFTHNSDGSINKIKTFLNNSFSQFLKDVKLNLSEYDKVITDFEPITSWASKWQDKEIWGLGNQYSFFSDKTPRPANKDRLSEIVLKTMSPVNNYIGLHYEEYDEFIYHPIIRDDIINSKICNKGHYAVYLPNFKLKSFINILIQFRGIQFHVFSNEVTDINTNRNCVILPLNKEEFLDSFISSEGIITTGGFQTTSEAIYCGKKLLVIPIKGQYEQECNVVALKKMGIMCGDLESISGFLFNSLTIGKKWIDPTDKIIENILNGDTKL